MVEGTGASLSRGTRQPVGASVMCPQPSGQNRRLGVDVIERLRARNVPHGWLELADEAAAEIAKLRALLFAIYEDTDCGQQSMSHDVRQRLSEEIEQPR